MALPPAAAAAAAARIATTNGLRQRDAACSSFAGQVEPLESTELFPARKLQIAKCFFGFPLDAIELFFIRRLINIT